MKVSLGLILGCMSAVMVLMTAAITLSVAFVTSLESLRAVGNSHATSLAAVAAQAIGAHFEIPATALAASAQRVAYFDVFFPSEDPALATSIESAAQKFNILQMQVSATANHSYGAVAFIFDDGSGSNLYQLSSGYLFWYLRVKNATTSTATAFRSTATSRVFSPALGREVHPSTVANLPVVETTSDARFKAYFTAKALLGTSRAGMWYPISVISGDSTGLIARTEFGYPAVTPLYNASGAFIGIMSTTVPIAYVNAALNAVRGTPGTQIFVVDGSGYLLGTSLPTTSGSGTNFSHLYKARTVTESFDPRSCVSSATTSTNASELPTIGCRAAAIDFAPSPALQQVATAVDFATVTHSTTSTIDVGGQAHFAVVAPIRNPFRAWTASVVLVMPETDLIGDVVSKRNILIGIVAVVVIVAAISSLIAAHILLSPVRDVSRRMLATALLRSDVEHHPASSYIKEVHALEYAYNDLRTAIGSFTRYVPRQVVKALIASGELCSIKMESKRCTVLFADIAGFTTVCERVPPDALSKIVTAYFERATEIMMQHEGLIDKYIGDAIMVVWGAPFRCPNHEVKATLAGLLLNCETKDTPLATLWDEVGELLHVRVGIASGDVLAGNMGSSERMNYTVIGDTVNLASRLESLNKKFATRLMVAEATASMLTGVFCVRLLIPIAVVGKTVPVRVYEVVGLLPQTNPIVFESLQHDDSAEVAGESQQGSRSATLSVAEHTTSREAFALARSSAVALIKGAALLPAAVATPQQVELSDLRTRAVGCYMRMQFDEALKIYDEVHEIEHESSLVDFRPPMHVDSKLKSGKSSVGRNPLCDSAPPSGSSHTIPLDSRRSTALPSPVLTSCTAHPSFVELTEAALTSVDDEDGHRCGGALPVAREPAPPYLSPRSSRQSPHSVEEVSTAARRCDSVIGGGELELVESLCRDYAMNGPPRHFNGGVYKALEK